MVLPGGTSVRVDGHADDRALRCVLVRGELAGYLVDDERPSLCSPFITACGGRWRSQTTPSRARAQTLSYRRLIGVVVVVPALAHRQ